MVTLCSPYLTLGSYTYLYAAQSYSRTLYLSIWSPYLTPGSFTYLYAAQSYSRTLYISIYAAHILLQDPLHIYICSPYLTPGSFTYLCMRPVSYSRILYISIYAAHILLQDPLHIYMQPNLTPGLHNIVTPSEYLFKAQTLIIFNKYIFKYAFHTILKSVFYIFLNQPKQSSQLLDQP